MGIPNLLRLLKNISKRQRLNNYKGKKAGIDGYTWLHRSLYCIGEGILKNPIEITKCINFFTKKLQLLLDNEITPIFIFDGDKLPMKLIEEDKREIKRKEYEKEAENMLNMYNTYGAIRKKIEAFDVTPEFAYEFMKILQNYNVEYYVAPYEADAQLAYLSHINYVDFIITEDSDLLAYGCNCVLFKLGSLKDQPNDMGEEILWENIKNCKEIKFKNFSKDKFLSFCILCGCDYLKISGVGPKLSNEALNKFDDYNKFLGYVFNKNCIQGSIIETIKRYEKTFLTFRYQVVYCPKDKKMKYFHDINEHIYPFLDKYKNDLSFLGVLDFDNIEDYVHGEINPITKEYIDPNNDNYYIASNIYDISFYKKTNNQKTLDIEDLYINDDLSEKSSIVNGKKKSISKQDNNYLKIGQYKGGQKKKKSERPKNQVGIDSFFLDNNKNKVVNKKETKNLKKKSNKNANSISPGSNENNNENQNNNEDNKSRDNDDKNINLNSFDNYSFKISNFKNKRTFNELDKFKENKQGNITKNFQNSGLHLSSTDLNCCYNPFTQYKKENKTKKPIINSKQKKLYNKFCLKFKDEDDEEEKKEQKKKVDLINLDSYNYSETNFNSTKDEFTLPSTSSGSGEFLKKSKNMDNKNYYVNKPGIYMASFDNKHLYKSDDNGKNEECIKIEDEKNEIKYDEKKDENKEKDKDKEEDNSFNFEQYKNTVFLYDKF